MAIAGIVLAAGDQQDCMEIPIGQRRVTGNLSLIVDLADFCDGETRPGRYQCIEVVHRAVLPEKGADIFPVVQFARSPATWPTKLMVVAYEHPAPDTTPKSLALPCDHNHRNALGRGDIVACVPVHPLVFGVVSRQKLSTP